MLTDVQQTISPKLMCNMLTGKVVKVMLISTNFIRVFDVNFSKIKLDVFLL